MPYYGPNVNPPDMPEMTPLEERRLFREYRRTGDPKVKDRLVRRYLCWAFAIASKLKGPRLPHEEAISAANHGLSYAIEKFKPGRNLRFTTYAYLPVRRFIIEALVQTYPVTISTHARKKLKKAAAPKTELGEHETPRTMTEAFERLGTSVEFDQHENGTSGPAVSSFKQAYEKDRDRLPEERDHPDRARPAPGEQTYEDSPVAKIEESDLADEVRNFIETGPFTDLEREVLLARHYSDPAESLESLSNRMHCAKNKIRQAYDAALRRLRERFNPGAKD